MLSKLRCALSAVPKLCYLFNFLSHSPLRPVQAFCNSNRLRSSTCSSWWLLFQRLSLFSSFSKQDLSCVALVLFLSMLLVSGSRNFLLSPPALCFRALQDPSLLCFSVAGIQLKLFVYCTPQAGASLPCFLASWTPEFDDPMVVPEFAWCRNIPEYILSPGFCLLHLQWHRLYGILLLFWKYFSSNLLFFPATDYLSFSVLNIWKLNFYVDCFCFLTSHLYLKPLYTGKKSTIFCFCIWVTVFSCFLLFFWWILLMFLISLPFSKGRCSMLSNISTSWRCNSFSYFN